MQVALLSIAGTGAIVAAAASIAERRRSRRADIDKVGLLPLPAIIFAGLLTAILAFAFAVRS